MVDRLFSLPRRLCGLRALVMLAPVAVGVVGRALLRKGVLGIAGRLAWRAVIVMGLGFGLLATVATLALVRTGLQEIQRRHLPAVVELAARLSYHQRAPKELSLPRELALFRAGQPEAGAAILWGSSCRMRCLAVAADPGSIERVRACAQGEIAHPPDARALHVVTLDGAMHLVVPAVIRDATGLPTGHLLVAMRAGWVADRALPTATPLLALACALLALCGW